MSLIDFDPDDSPLAPPLSIDPDDILAEARARMRENAPGWTAYPTAPDNLMFGAVAQTNAVAREAFKALLVEVTTELIGQMANVPRLDGAPARSSVTVTAIDALGHSEDAGMRVFVGDVECQTTEPLTVAVGETTGTAAIETVEASATANDATGDVELDALPWTAENGVTLDGPLHSGEDPEGLLDYQLRLVGEIGVPRRAVRGEDFVFYVTRGPYKETVGACWAIKGLNPDTNATGLALTETIFIVDTSGEALSDDTLAEIQTWLRSLTVENFDIYARSPNYVTVSASGTVRTAPGYDQAATHTAAAARITESLNPLVFARQAADLDQTIDTGPADMVHKNDLVAVAKYVLGVWTVPSMQVGDGSSSSVALPGGRTLPRAGTVTITEAP